METAVYRVVDVRTKVIDAVERTVQAHSPEQAVKLTLDIDTVRVGPPINLVARVYWKTADNDPINMARMYLRSPVAGSIATSR